MRDGSRRHSPRMTPSSRWIDARSPSTPRIRTCWRASTFGPDASCGATGIPAFLETRRATCIHRTTPTRSQMATPWSPTSSTSESWRSRRTSASSASLAAQVRTSITRPSHSPRRTGTRPCKTAEYWSPRSAAAGWIESTARATWSGASTSPASTTRLTRNCFPMETSWSWITTGLGRSKRSERTGRWSGSIG